MQKRWRPRCQAWVKTHLMGGCQVCNHVTLNKPPTKRDPE